MARVGVISIIVVLFLLLFSLLVLSFAEKQVPQAVYGGKELQSPGDWISENQIKVYHNKVVLDVPNAVWAQFTNTNSMDPSFDETSNALEIKPENPYLIHVGDIIAYNTPYGTIIHRVVEVGEDREGIYYLVKGDNNTLPDPFKVRFADVEGVVIAIIY